MKLLKFNAEQLKTGDYELLTSDGRAVKLGHIDPTERAAIFGWVSGFACIWDINGTYITTKNMSKYDLKLKPISQTLHITVTRGKNEKINVYCSTEGLPKVKSGSTLLKRLQVELD
jgi:hypothetical protein